MRKKQITSLGKLPSDWRVVSLPDYVFFQEGPGLRKWQWTTDGMKVINVTNILSDGSVDVNNTGRYISLDEFRSKYSHFSVEDDDIVVASSGNTYGKVGRINSRHLPIMMNTSVIRFHPRDPEIVHPGFLYAFIRSPLFRDQIETYVIGSAQPNFGPYHLKRMSIPVPPFRIQRRVADIIGAYDGLIEANIRRIEILEEMAQMIYREWFVNFRFPGHEKVKMVTSEMGDIPDGWRSRRVSEAVEIDPTTEVPREGLKPFVPMGSLSANSMLITEIELREGNSGSKFRNGDTLFARITPCLENGKTGFVQFLSAPEAVAFGSTEFMVLRSMSVCPEYVYLMARSDEFRNNAIKSMSGATGRQRVQPGCFEKFRITQPPESVLQSFRSLVGPMFRMIHVLNVKNEILRKTRDLLLPKLVSGEISVEEIETEATAQTV